MCKQEVQGAVGCEVFGGLWPCCIVQGTGDCEFYREVYDLLSKCLLTETAKNSSDRDSLFG